MSSEALAKEDTLPAFVAELLRRSRLGGFRRRHKRDHGCIAVGLHETPECSTTEGAASCRGGAPYISGNCGSYE